MSSVARILKVKRYQIEAKSIGNTTAPEGAEAIQLIILEGVPYSTNSNVKRAELHFMPDSRAKAIPEYQESKQQVVANYPIRIFESYLKLLQQLGKNEVLLLYYHDEQSGSVEVILRVYDELPSDL